MNAPDFYEVLGVARDATQAQIKAAYRNLSKQHHPDAGAADGEVMRAINAAYEVLGNPDRRANYDKVGADVDLGALALERLHSLFELCLDRVHEQRNLHRELMSQVDGELTDIRDQRRQAVAVLARYDRIGKRMRRKKAQPGDDIFQRVKEVKAAVVRRQLADLELGIKILERLRELVVAYEDVAPPATTTSVRFTFGDKVTGEDWR